MPFLAFDDRLLGDDDGIDVLADGHAGPDVLAGKERAVGVGNLGTHQEGRGGAVHGVVDEDRLAGVGMQAVALDGQC